MSTFLRHCVRSVAAAALGLAAGAAALAAPPLRITLDTPPSHVRNRTMDAFVKALSAQSGGALQGQVFGSGQLYSSRDEMKAIARGDVDMGVTSTAALTRVVSDLEVISFPMYSGLPESRTHEIVDGPLGQKLAAMVGDKLGVVVPGKWFMLGTLGTFTTKTPIKTFADLEGLKIRTPGGAVLAHRIRALKANAVSMPFPDVPLALQQGVVDGILSTDASIDSGKLFDSGIRYGFADRVVVGYYMPLVSQKYWSQLSADQKQLFVKTWNEFAAKEREDALAEQHAARANLEKLGVKYVVPDAAALQAFRESLLKTQGSLYDELKISPEVRSLAEAAAK